jgi:hypothetical protein
MAREKPQSKNIRNEKHRGGGGGSSSSSSKHTDKCSNIIQQKCHAKGNRKQLKTTVCE